MIELVGRWLKRDSNSCAGSFNRLWLVVTFERELGILGREDRDEFGWCDFTCFNFNLSFKKNDVAVDLATDVV